MFFLLSLFLTLPQTRDLVSSLYFYFIYYILIFFNRCFFVCLFFVFVGLLFLLWLTDCGDMASSWITSNKPSPRPHRSHRTMQFLSSIFAMQRNKPTSEPNLKATFTPLPIFFFSFCFKCKAINQVAWKPLQWKNLTTQIFLSCRVSWIKLDHLKCLTEKKKFNLNIY